MNKQDSNKISNFNFKLIILENNPKFDVHCIFNIIYNDLFSVFEIKNVISNNLKNQK